MVVGSAGVLVLATLLGPVSSSMTTPERPQCAMALVSLPGEPLAAALVEMPDDAPAMLPAATVVDASVFTPVALRCFDSAAACLWAGPTAGTCAMPRGAAPPVLLPAPKPVRGDLDCDVLCALTSGSQSTPPLNPRTSRPRHDQPGALSRPGLGWFPVAVPFSPGTDPPPESIDPDRLERPPRA